MEINKVALCVSDYTVVPCARLMCGERAAAFIQSCGKEEGTRAISRHRPLPTLKCQPAPVSSAPPGDRRPPDPAPDLPSPPQKLPSYRRRGEADTRECPPLSLALFLYIYICI